MSSAKLTGRFARSHPAMATAATWKASRILQTTFVAQRTSAMRWISQLTTGGPYVTAEIRTSFKGYYRTSRGESVALMRSFVQFDGVGDTVNARPRAIGGHPAVLVRGQCLLKAPGDPYANDDGYVPFGQLVNYTGGRSNGCTTWSPSDAEQIIPIVKDKPTTLYIYPELTDIVAVAAFTGTSMRTLLEAASVLSTPKWLSPSTSTSSFHSGRKISVQLKLEAKHTIDIVRFVDRRRSTPTKSRPTSASTDRT